MSIEMGKNMIDFIMLISGRAVAVNAMFESTRNFCNDYLIQREADFFVMTTAEDITIERKKSAQEDALEGILARHFSDAYLETLAVQRKIAEKLFVYDTLLFHGSAVAVDGQAYLFTAKSGTGKSTHTRLWREMLGDRAVMVNDDKPFLQLTDHGVIVHGSPWNGKHRLGSNISVPLKAICILERSRENWIKPITAAQALPMLFQQSQRPQNPANMAKYMELIDRLANGVQFWKMGCNMDPEAALVSYEAMFRERKETL